MSTSAWSWNGARWWRFDFHTHTPMSEDYGKGAQQTELKKRAPEEWLLDYMKAGIDCVAVTDHNTGAWIDTLKETLLRLGEEKPDGWRSLTLFPGVEISAHGGVHVLAILDPQKATSDVDRLLGAVKFSGTPGHSDGVTEQSVIEVVRAIHAAGGIAIPAHADRDQPCGLFLKQTGETLKQTLGCEELFTIEVVDPRTPKPSSYTELKLAWTEVLGSDAHHPTGDGDQRYPGSHFTWVKMGQPDLDGLRLALLDGPLSVKRSDEVTGDPNEHAPQVLESFQVSEAFYMGRSEPLTLELNPWLNAVIGGRGTGKSTLVEFLRIVLRRDSEVPKALADDFEKYVSVGNRDDDGLLTTETKLAAIYRKDGAKFKLQWSPSGGVEPILQKGPDDGWTAAVGDVPKRFPVRIFSQKQVFQLAKEPGALLRVIDDAPEVGRHAWNERWRAEESRFLSLRARAREMEAGLTEEPRLLGELDDIKRKLAVFEEEGHSNVLREFQRRRRQQGAVKTWEDEWANAGDRIRQLADDVVPDALESSIFDSASLEDAELLEIASQARGEMDGIRQALKELAERTDAAVGTWARKRDDSTWKSSVSSAQRQYEALQARLATEGAGDPMAYGELVQNRQAVEQRLRTLAGRREQVVAVQQQAEESRNRLVELRRQLTKLRDQFLNKVLAENRYVVITVKPYGAREAVESELRRILGKEGGEFGNDIGRPDGEGLLGRLYRNDPDQEDESHFEERLDQLKRDIRSISQGQPSTHSARDPRFATLLTRLDPEALDRLELWFPEDSLDVKYSASSDGRNLRSIQEGSPGQRTAALLAFLLSYGDEPLILDQPEDDLDNHLIYELIVNQLREVKAHRQIIVVTHNSNIVVNGDAELVVALQARGGQTYKEAEGSLQDTQVRETICAVMEGGRDAFERRYRRIALETRHD